MSLYSDSATGTLTPAALDKYIEITSIDEPSNESGSGTLGLTPLALAARNGHADVVRLLLGKGAKVDALSTQNRTPLWIVTSRGRGDERVQIVDLLLQQGAKARYSHPNLHFGSTPLENELKQLKDADVVQLLVNKGGLTDKATKQAAELKQPEIDDAMKSTEQRSQLRAAIIGLITALILFILAWANSPVVSGIANSVFKKFQISGNKDSPTAKKIATEIPEPKTKEDFKNSVGSFVQEHNLDDFFPPGEDSPFLETLVSKAVDLQNDDSSVLGQTAKTEDLVKFALYQPVIYCDDSGSMSPDHNDLKEDRISDQRDLVQRIAGICTQIVPDHHGVHLRFINQIRSDANNLREADVERIMSETTAGGATMIGTQLREQILEPLVYNVPKLTRPVFVSIITDGIPGPSQYEKRARLMEEILECQNWLQSHDPPYPPRAVVFQISQIGSDPASKTFLNELNEEPRLKENVYITAQQLDSKFRELKGNERDLEAWLFQTLLTPILGVNSE
ncbi:ankyrin repeat protein [Xylariaceae sp. AK1471]|nr:ankyrin repeat protein [Xylariaceae sp. AK1471]